MDAFAESQMGRDTVDDPNAMSPQPAMSASRRAKRASKEQMAKRETNQELLAVEASPIQEYAPVDVQMMSCEESALIASRWERKKSAFMPVGDPYAEADPNTPYAKQLAQQYCTCSSFAMLAVRSLKSLFPIIEWLPMINWSSLRADVIAGLTVGVMLIPQSMSYADIAGLQYKYGMYTSVLPVITYALMGTSRQLGVGPVAMVSLLVEVGLNGALTREECPDYYAQLNTSSPLYIEDPEERLQQNELCPDQYAQLAFLTSLLVGVFQLAAGFLRLGFLVSFLAHPVISGFTSAAAIIIGLSQAQYFFGFKIPKTQYVHETLQHIFTKLKHTQYEQLLFGLAWWFMLSMSRRIAAHPKYKKRFGWLKPTAPLITCVLAILVAGNLRLFNGCGFVPCDSNSSLSLVVGEIPSGVSSMGSIQLLDFGRFSTVVSAAVSCAVIGYMESIAIAKSLAAKHKYEVDAGQELLALGIANMLGSVTSAYPVTGSFSRSAVNNQVGAQTQLSGLITGLLLLFTLLFLTPIFKFLPKFALAAIVIASVTNLVDYKEALHLYKVKKQDCFLWVIAFVGTLFLGVQVGLMIAIGFSLILVIVETVRPQMTLLWRLPNTPIYRSIKQESAGAFVPGVIILRIGASMYFANVAFIRDYISKMIGEFSEAGNLNGEQSKHNGKAGGVTMTRTRRDSPPDGDTEKGSMGMGGVEKIRYIVIEMTPVASIDSTALHMLEDMHRDLKERGIRLAFSTINNRVEETLSRAGLIDKMGSSWVHPSVHSAVQHCIRHRQKAAMKALDGNHGEVTAHAVTALDGTVDTENGANGSVVATPLGTPATTPAPGSVLDGSVELTSALSVDSRV